MRAPPKTMDLEKILFRDRCKRKFSNFILIETIRDAFEEEVRGSSSNVAPFGDTFTEEEETEDVSVSTQILAS
jgi:hypothetical protein